LAQAVTSANLLGAIASGTPSPMIGLPASNNGGDQFAAILSETAQAQSVNMPPQPSGGSDVTLTPAALARFTTSTPGAFHPRTAFQKVLTEAEPQLLSQTLPLLDMPPGIETKPASSTLLSLLGVSTGLEAETADEDITTSVVGNSDAVVNPQAIPPVPVQAEPLLINKAEFSADTVATPVSAVPVAPARTNAAIVTQEAAEAAAKSDAASSSGIDQNTPKAEADTSASAKSPPQIFTVPQAQNLATTSVSHSAATITTQTTHTPATPIAQVSHLISVEAGKLDAGGTREFTIRLDPAELGRIDVKLEVKADGYVTAVVQADQASTYDLLRQDARQFEQSLWDSGLKTNSDSLNFSLRRDDQSTFAQLMSGDGQSGRDANKQGNLSDMKSDEQTTRQPANHRLSLSHIDVMA
jgi:flagellar hook-length control protein FliK